jgi:uncharacterized membrane protein
MSKPTGAVLVTDNTEQTFDNPMFLFAASYTSVADAQADYAIVKALHTNGDIGSYDSDIISKGFDGKVKVSKTEKPTQHGAWIGLAAGAAAALIFPPLAPAAIAAAGAAGAGYGAWIGHLAYGTSRADARQIGALLPEGGALLIVVGVNKDAKAVDKAINKATKKLVKTIKGDYKAAEKEVTEMLKQV